MNIDVVLGNASYEIFVRPDILEGISGHLREKPIGNRYVVITDSNVMGLYGEYFLDSFRRDGLGTSPIIISPGEDSKNLATLEEISHHFCQKGVDRDTAIIALGGGLVGDLTGFIASIYMRGIPYIQVPTTLLSQVDSCVGGKTGINLPEGKNLLGTFYHPSRVYVDPSVLDTLPKREIRSGLAEVVKYGVIKDKNFFRFLEENVDGIMALDKELISEIIERCLRIKLDIAEEDEREENLRSVLNYGHTLGHALEFLTDYNHGESVAVGMVFTGSLAFYRELFSREDLERQNRLLRRFGLPARVPDDIDIRDLIRLMISDKKGFGENVNLVLPRSIGLMYREDNSYRIPVSEDELRKVMENMIYD